MARNERGQYLDPKPITENGPTYAKGCAQCTFGIVAAPALTQAVPLYLERLIQAIDGDITFCACQAGQSYRTSLLKRHKTVTEQDKAAMRIVTHKTAGSEQALNPDNTLRIDSALEIARNAVNFARAKSVPTIHFEAVPA